MKDKQIVVIGGGPAGYVGAIRAAQLGGRVTLVEEKHLGGTCLNEGCIPTKALIESVRRWEELREAQEFGIVLPGDGEPSLDLAQVMARKEAVVSRLVGGVEYLMQKHGVTVIRGRGHLLAPGRVRVVGAAGTEAGGEVAADAVILATGSEPAVIPGFEPDGEWIITSTEALAPRQVPGSLLVVGGGVVGVELAGIYRAWGAEVTIMELMPQLLPGEDADVAAQLERSLKRSRVTIYTSARAGVPVETREGLLEVTAETPRGLKTVRVEQILVAAGRRPRPAGIDTAGLGLATDRGALQVNDRMETGVPGIWAAGDVIGGYLLAHAAFREGEAAAENAMGRDARVDHGAVPRCVYTTPEVGSVGMTEAAAREREGEVLVGRFPFTAAAKAQIEGMTSGFVKVVAARDGRLLGVSIVGPRASELVAPAAVALVGGMDLEGLSQLVAAHPTLSEAFKEALLAAQGRAVHI